MKTLARELMNPKPVVVYPETLLIEAASILVSRGFNGLPVVDHDNKVVGILTEYDLIIEGSNIHLPTLIRMFQEMDLYRNDSKMVGNDLQKLLDTTVRDVMNKEPMTVLDDTTLDAAAKIFGEHHRVNPLLIVDQQNKLIGILTRHDLIKLIGGYSLEYGYRPGSREVDRSVNKFLKNFDERFVMVSRFRTKTWLLFSALFFVTGFVVAFAFIIRINLR